MRIQYKLSITFVLLLVFGVTAISSYSIVFIRGYLMNQAEEDMKADARQLLVSMQLASYSDRPLPEVLDFIGRDSHYDIRLFSEGGELLASTYRASGEQLSTEHLSDETIHAETAYPATYSSNERFFVIEAWAGEQQTGAPMLLEVSRLKDEIYRPVRTIRWIIYSGMFISIAIILFVSFIFSNYLAKPILALTRASQQIADGDTTHSITLNRTDEFGTLAQSLNRMAARLQEDNQQLKIANNRQKQFYADIAHEIRNPLHTISGALEMLDMDKLSAEQRHKYLKSAQNQTERMNRLFKDMMTLQRSDLDPNFLHVRSFPLHEIMENLEQAYSDQARDKGLRLITKGEPVDALGDPDKIEQVLDNLLSNGIKYTSEGSVTMSWEPVNGKVIISVTDTGIGIQKEYIPKLFDRFFRTDKARSRDSGGTGLGLAVVKSILDAHKIEIEVESRPGDGTTFSFSLPLAGKTSASAAGTV